MFRVVKGYKGGAAQLDISTLTFAGKVSYLVKRRTTLDLIFVAKTLHGIWSLEILKPNDTYFFCAS